MYRPALTDSIVIIDRQDDDRRAADRSSPNNPRPTPAEVLFPGFAAWMKQLDDSTCPRIDAAKIRAFVRIAEATRKRQKLLAQSSEPLHDQLCFHCQEAAE